jgi:dihydroneopterin aldolase
MTTSSKSSKTLYPVHQQVAQPAVRRVFVKDLVLAALIGVHRHEKDGRQRVRINLDMDVVENEEPIQDRLADVVCYEDVVTAIRAIVAAGHINLVESLAELVADRCLKDRRVKKVRVRVEKLDVFADASSVGVEIERFNLG